jgi:hypothetical protein
MLFAAILFMTAAWRDTARAADLTGVYFGGNFGRSRDEYNTGMLDGELDAVAQSVGATPSYSRKSAQRISDVWWVDAGYFFTPYVGLDAAFIRLGQVRYVAVGKVTNLAGTDFLSSSTEVASRGPALSAVLRLPIIEAVEVDLRLGDYLGKASSDAGLTVGANSDYQPVSKSGSSLLAGVGGAYSIDGHWSVRVDYLRVNDTRDSATTGKFSVNLATLGVSFTF